MTGERLSDASFAVAVALTEDHALMACGFLAALRELHPGCDLFVITDQRSLPIATEIASAFGGASPIVTDRMGFDCLEWGPIVTAKFRVFALPTTKPVVFLDIDQIITQPIDAFVRQFIEANVVLAGGGDDETLGAQFKDGAIPAGLDPAERRVINTGAFITIPDPEMFAAICDAIPRFSGLARLPTQGLINGLLYERAIDFLAFGDEFMIGPFNAKILDQPSSAALLHLWTPRPPFMTPNPKRVGVDGDLTWEICVDRFEAAMSASYPFEFIRDGYMKQIRMFEELNGAAFPQIVRNETHRAHYNHYLSRNRQFVSEQTGPSTDR